MGISHDLFRPASDADSARLVRYNFSCMQVPTRPSSTAPELPDYLRPNEITLNDMRPNTKNLALTVIILEKKDTIANYTRFVVADETGSATLSIFGTLATLLDEEDIIRITGAYSRLFKNNLSLGLDKHNARIEKVGEFTKVFKRNPNYSAWIWHEDVVHAGQMIPFMPGATIPQANIDATLAAEALRAQKAKDENANGKRIRK